MNFDLIKTLANKFDLYRVKMSHNAKYLRQRSFCYCPDTHTHWTYGSSWTTNAVGSNVTCTTRMRCYNVMNGVDDDMVLILLQRTTASYNTNDTLFLLLQTTTTMMVVVMMIMTA